MDHRELTAALKMQAKQLGFAQAGVCPAVTPPRLHRFHAWLDSGYAGAMRYLSARRDAYSHPRNVLDGSKSLVILSMCYRTDDPAPTSRGQGRVSRYAWGSVDYHNLIHGRLQRLAAWLTEREPVARVRGVVDTAPLLEREFAQLAGLGWIGKNTMLLSRELGSWFYLAALLTDIELEYDAPYETDHCGTCRACLDACPTNAFPEPYRLDATRCVSYLTIELRDEIPAELRDGVGDWLFGCDVCQEVCPWNQHAPISLDPGFAAREGMNPVDLEMLSQLDDEAFRTRFRHTPLWRAKLAGLRRNAAVVQENQQQ